MMFILLNGIAEIKVPLCKIGCMEKYLGTVLTCSSLMYKIFTTNAMP